MTDEKKDTLGERPYARVPCFVSSEEINSFEKSIIALMVELRDAKTQNLICEDNVLVYNHGGGWHQRDVPDWSRYLDDRRTGARLADHVATK